MRDNKTRILTVSALMTAFVYIATYIGTALPFSRSEEHTSELQ